MRWRKLEPNLQSKVSQKEKHRYGILTVYVWNSEVPGTGDYEATNKKYIYIHTQSIYMEFRKTVTTPYIRQTSLWMGWGGTWEGGSKGRGDTCIRG